MLAADVLICRRFVHHPHQALAGALRTDLCSHHPQLLRIGAAFPWDGKARFTELTSKGHKPLPQVKRVIGRLGSAVSSVFRGRQRLQLLDTQMPPLNLAFLAAVDLQRDKATGREILNVRVRVV